jgi:hypothetical protein
MSGEPGSSGDGGERAARPGGLGDLASFVLHWLCFAVLGLVIFAPALRG